MKMKVVAISRVNKSGISQKGSPYNIDRTDVTVEVPYSTPEGFGFKYTTYRYGKSDNFTKLEQYRSKLPVELDIELGVELNQYEMPETVIVNIGGQKAV